MRNARLAFAPAVALMLIGVARDAFGRVFLLADTPVGALVLLALLLAAINQWDARGKGLAADDEREDCRTASVARKHAPAKTMDRNA